MLQYTSLIIHDVCVKKPMCVSLHGWVRRLHENVTVDEKHVNNKWYCEKHSYRGRLRERKTWEEKKKAGLKEKVEEW